MLRGDSEPTTVRLGELGLGRRKIYGAVGHGDEAAGSDSMGAQPGVTKVSSGEDTEP